MLLASFPGPAHSSLAERNLCRGPGLVHHMMCAAGHIVTLAENVCCVAEYMHKGVRSCNKSSAYDILQS